MSSPKHILHLDGHLYMLKPTTGGLLKWTSAIDYELGSPFVSEREALKWVQLMLKYEWSGGRAHLLEKYTAVSK